MSFNIGKIEKYEKGDQSNHHDRLDQTTGDFLQYQKGNDKYNKGKNVVNKLVHNWCIKIVSNE
ncbi:hypothetical protein [Segatella cerevisiae]|uniref:hypothetical protein n=1 Tax=Segatella cerevisiae TaxID=2053716 RepID=UPI00209004EB|nr:hypothetical protein [Segatella cerevisiae]